MARYDTYGQNDDRMVEELDTGFIGFNNRLRPDQLSPGLLTSSSNGRLGINGEWQTRKPMSFLAAPFPAAPLRVGNVRLHDTNSVGTILSTALDVPSGTLTITFTGDVFPYAGVTAADWVGYVVYLDGWEGDVPIDGNQIITDAPANDQIEVVISGLTTIDTEGTVEGPQLDDTAINAVEDAIAYSDPNNDSESYVFCVGTSKASVVNTATNIATLIDYPTGQKAVGGKALQAFNKVFIFRDGEVAMEWDGTLTGTPAFTLVANGDYTQPAHLATSAGEFKITDNIATVAVSSSVSVGGKVFLVSKTEDNQTSGLASQFEFDVKDVYYANGTVNVSSASATSITGGDYDGLDRIVLTTASAHGFKVGEPINIEGFTSPDTGINGKRVVAAVGSTTEFTIYVDGNFSASPSVSGVTVGIADGFTFIIPEDGRETDADGNVVHVTDGESLGATPIFSEVPSEGSGFTHMPAPPFGEYHQKRIVAPYKYEMSEDSNGTRITSRGIQDEIIFSQILDSDTYDYIYGQFRFNAGTSDYLVGLHSFSEDKLVVFNRSSIHLVSNSLNLKDSVSTLITNEVGCVARKSIVQVANNLLFLSDNGVYGVDFQDLYNLRGRDLPLSATIEATIADLNKAHMDKAVAVYFDNRYFIAVPTGSSQTNNKLLIYNFINKNWESIDSIAVPSWEFTHLAVAGKGSDRGVYAINKNGGVHKLESGAGSDDQYVVQVGSEAATEAILSSATTRMYTLRSIDRKKWNNFDLHIESETGLASGGNLSATTENVDSTIDLGTLASYNGGDNLSPGEDYSIRGRFGNKRAYGLQFTLDATFGRPKLRSLKVAGTTTFRNLETAE